MDAAALQATLDGLNSEMPPATAEIFERDPRPFFQAIFDFISPRIVFGRVALLGDAAFLPLRFEVATFEVRFDELRRPIQFVLAVEHHQRLVQCIERIRGSGMMISTGGSPIPKQQVQIHEPALYFSLSVLDEFHRAFGKADRRQPGRARQTFLAAGVDRIDLPFIYLDRGSSQRGDGIHNSEAIIALSDLTKRFRV